MPALAASVADLITATATAKRLSDALMARADEIRSAWPEVGDIPPEIREHTERIARATLMKQFPAEFVALVETAGRKRDQSAP